MLRKNILQCIKKEQRSIERTRGEQTEGFGWIQSAEYWKALRERILQMHVKRRASNGLRTSGFIVSLF